MSGQMSELGQLHPVIKPGRATMASYAGSRGSPPLRQCLAHSVGGWARVCSVSCTDEHMQGWGCSHIELMRRDWSAAPCVLPPTRTPWLPVAVLGFPIQCSTRQLPGPPLGPSSLSCLGYLTMLQWLHGIPLRGASSLLLGLANYCLT